MNQSDTRVGTFAVPAGQDLTGMEGRLVVLTHDSGVPEVKLPATVNDPAVYLLVGGNTDGGLVSVQPWAANVSARVALKGTCVPGDKLVLADPAAPADAGKLRAQPVTAGKWFVLGLAEEKGADGQALLVRPAVIGLVIISA